MALKMMRDVAANIRSAKFYTFMADETADVLNTEQLVICIRWVNDDLNIHGDFVGLHPLAQADAETVAKVIKVSTIYFLPHLTTSSFIKGSFKKYVSSNVTAFVPPSLPLYTFDNKMTSFKQ